MEVLGGGTRLVHIRAETATAGRFDRVLTAQAGGVHLPLKVTFEVMAPDAVAIDTGVRGIVLELNETGEATFSGCYSGDGRVVNFQ